jgi:hypothetical protein
VIKTVDISIDRFHFAYRRSYIAVSNFDTFSFCSRPFASELFFCDATGGYEAERFGSRLASSR